MNSPSQPTLQAIRYTRGKLELLNQLLLPHKFEYDAVVNAEDAWQAIRQMKVRGAPAIAIAAVLGLAVEMHHKRQQFQESGAAFAFLQERLAYLKTSRPTAVNLFEATDRLEAQLQAVLTTLPTGRAGAEALIEKYISLAEAMLAKDVADNEALAQFGADYILKNGKKSYKVLTHCNTGSLATAAHGTALGVIRTLNALGKLEHAFATETRPYNQGARLTAFELVYERIPGTLITDSMAAFLMTTHELDAIVVGADRVVENGDTANKIGTYQLAILAKHHGVPFYVAAPSTSIDITLDSGKQIPIEMRPSEELTHIRGERFAAEGIGVWNPGFDVTPAELISAIFTERGVVTKNPNGKFSLKDFLKNNS